MNRTRSGIPQLATTLEVTEIATTLLAHEAQALLTRLDQVRPFVLTETMVLAAALPYRAHRAIERFLYDRRMELRSQVQRYLRWLGGPGRAEPGAEQQRRFVTIRMRFNDVLAQLDMFAEVITQRSEQGTGVWLSGLDRLAADALALPQPWIEEPPLICYLARGPGAAIRRVRTRLPGGALSPVGIIRVPRERMVGHGVASSVVHEVGHQGAALLELVEPLRAELRERSGGPDGQAWTGWELTASECIADFWSVAKLGIASTLGLLAVVSLPRFFVFRPPGADPHPMPYVRVLLSAAVGNLLYPHPQWQRLIDVWKSLYPIDDLNPGIQRQIAGLERTAPAMAEVMAGQRPAALRGLRLGGVVPDAARCPEQLLDNQLHWGDDLAILARQPPTLVFATVGQARASGRMSPQRENQLLSNVLTTWAVRSSIDVLERGDCAVPRTDLPRFDTARPETSRPTHRKELL